MPHLGRAIPAWPDERIAVPLAEGGKLISCINTELEWFCGVDF